VHKDLKELKEPPVLPQVHLDLQVKQVHKDLKGQVDLELDQEVHKELKEL